MLNEMVSLSFRWLYSLYHLLSCIRLHSQFKMERNAMQRRNRKDPPVKIMTSIKIMADDCAQFSCERKNLRHGNNDRAQNNARNRSKKAAMETRQETRREKNLIIIHETPLLIHATHLSLIHSLDVLFIYEFLLKSNTKHQLR